MDVESTFRCMFGVKKEQDMVGLIEAAVSVAALIAPQKLKKHRSRILKLLFDEHPANPNHDLFSDDELLGFDSDDDEDDKVASTPKDTSHSPEFKKRFKKTLEEELSAPQMPLMMMGRRDNKSIEKTKEVMLGRKYPREEEEEEEKRAAKKRKIQHVLDFPELKKHCCDGRISKAKPPSGNLRQPHATLKNELKARQHAMLKPKSKY